VQFIKEFVQSSTVAKLLGEACRLHDESLVRGDVLEVHFTCARQQEATQARLPC
jgi:hypothetical protein